MGNNIVNLSASALTTTYAIALFGSTAVGWATGVLTLAILIFGEITPKQLALAHSMKIAVFMAWPLRIISIILFPLVWLLRHLSGAITRLFASDTEPDVTHEGMRLMVDVAEDVGLVDQYESDLIERAIHFSKTQVRTIMTHRTNVFRLSDELLLSACYPAIVKSGYSRIPVYHENEENISGILLIRDVLRAQLKGKMEIPLSALVRPPVFIPEQMHLDDVFYRFKKDREKRHIDRIVEREDEPGVFLVMADTPFQQLIDDLDLDDDNHKNSTVAAYLLEQSGSIPQEGDVLTTPLGTFRVISMTGNRMEAVEFHPVGEDEMGR